MSMRYKGAVISATPPTTTGGESGTAPGAWTLEQQLQAQGAGNWPIPFVAKYIEDVFSTYLYTGNGSTQTITNGIDLAGKGGLVWGKNRDAGWGHYLADTANGVGKFLRSNTTDALNLDSTSLTAFNSTGFSIGNAGAFINNSGVNYASWTFRKQPKFFDVVTWTGDGTNKTISHNLGSTPGCIIAKRTNSTGSWYVYHRSLSTPNESWMLLQTTGASNTSGGTNIWNVTSTTFQADTYLGLSTSGDTYVAYVFAHDAGGFGLTGTDNVISCGSFTTDGSGNATVNLGYEPQFVLWKKSDGPVDGYSNWVLNDNMRGFTVDQGSQDLYPNRSDAEAGTGANFGCSPTSTGFKVIYQASKTYIYIAIRRGPMKVPTDATKVFAPVTYTGTGATRTITAGFPVDLAIPKLRNAATNGAEWYTRLIGPNVALLSAYTAGDLARPNELTSFASNTGVVLGDSSTSGGTNASGSTYVDWNFGRAPSFFDEVCYTGTGSNITLNHNLGAVPQLMIFKTRTGAARAWGVYSSTLGVNKKLVLNTTAAVANDSFFVDTTPTATVFYPGNADESNEGGNTYVAYLFATCAGVSKVGSYTGNGSTQTIDCGFTGGARFVLIKRTDSTGDWYVYDTARGMTTLVDPYLLLNSTAAESVTLGSVTTVTTGFAVNASILAAINTNGASYIFLAIA